MVLEAGKSKIRTPAGLGSGEGHFLVLGIFSLSPFMVGGSEGALWELFHKATDPINEGITLMPSSPPRGPIS